MKPPSAFIILLAACAVAAGADCLRAQEAAPLMRKIVLVGENNDAAARLKAADRLVDVPCTGETAAGFVTLAAAPQLAPLACSSLLIAERSSRQDWPAALEAYQSLIQDSGDVLVAIQTPPRLPAVRSVPVRRLCQLRIAAAPPAALRVYRREVNALAQRLFREGRKNHDVKPLKRIVNDLFCSRFGDQALDLLGDLAFEKGEFAEAIEWWRTLALPASEWRPGQPDTRMFPDPAVDLARVRAKLMIARAFQGERQQAQAELTVFRKRQGAARGTLAGKEGLYADIVEDIIRKAPTDLGEDSWLTFAGSGTRNHVVKRKLSPRLWAEGPTWRVSFGNPLNETRAGLFTRLAARLCFFPVIADDRVLIADANTVTAFDLLSGRQLFRYDANLRIGLPARAAPRFSLSVAGDRVYARLGAQGLGPTSNSGDSFLVCLQMPPRGDEGKPARIREVWKVAAREPFQFEGAPLVHDGRVYVARSRVENRHTKTSLACHDAISGKLQWERELCETPEFEEPTAMARFRHHLLTLAGNNVIHCSHSGAIVALDRLSGKWAWAVRYPGREAESPEARAASREPCPCIYHFGRVYVAPADAKRVLCLDASTGQLVWERDDLTVAELLGVCRGKLLLTTPANQPGSISGLRALHADTGLSERDWQFPDSGSLPAFGRGLLASDWILFSTLSPASPVRVLQQANLEQVFDPSLTRRIHAGNMAFGQGCLVVAGVDELVAYVSPERMLHKLQVEAARPGATAKTFYRLGEAEATAGHFQLALKHFSQAATLSGQRRQGTLQTRALHSKHQLLMRMSGFRMQTDQKAAIDLVEQASDSEFPPAERVSSYLRLAKLCLRAGKLDRAVSVYEKIQRDDDLRQVRMLPGFEPAGAFAGSKITKLKGLKDKSSLIVERPRQPEPSLLPVEGRPQTPLKQSWSAVTGTLLIPARNGFSPVQESCVFFADTGKLVCRDAATGHIRWSRDLGFTPTWLGLHAELVLAAGPQAIQAVRSNDGERRWTFAAPFVQQPVGIAEENTAADGELSAFHLTGTRLFFLLDRRRLIVLEPETGNPLWDTAAPQAFVQPLGAGSFCPRFYADDKLVFIQTAEGRRLSLDGKSGILLNESVGSRTPWPQEPVFIDKGKLCVVEDGRVLLLDVYSGREVWSYKPTFAASLSGEPLHVIREKQALLVLVPRNGAPELTHLDPRSGRSPWPDELRLISLHQSDSRPGAAPEEGFPLAYDDVLTSWSVASGKRIWQAPLKAKSSKWQVARTSDALFVYPTDDHPPPLTWLPAGSFLLGIPNMHLQETRVRHRPLSIHDPATGRMMQELDFAVPAPRLDVQILNGGLVVVAAAGRAWGLRP